MTLRNGLLTIAGAAFVIALLLLVSGTVGGIAIGLDLALGALVVVLALVFERRGYNPKATNSAALRRTDERMIDPVSGKLLEVWEDPRNGTREYRDVETGR